YSDFGFCNVQPATCNLQPRDTEYCLSRPSPTEAEVSTKAETLITDYCSLFTPLSSTHRPAHSSLVLRSLAAILPTKPPLQSAEHIACTFPGSPPPNTLSRPRPQSKWSWAVCCMAPIVWPA